jgi:hypothetical protein
MLAIIRPGSWNILLLIHVAGAMALVALLILAIFAVGKAAATGDQPTTRFAFRTLLLGVLPAFIAMRVGAQLIVSKEDLTSSNATWIGIGFGVSDGGLLLLIVLLVLTGLAARRAKAGTRLAGTGGLRAARVLTQILVAACVVAIFAMTAKPD